MLVLLDCSIDNTAELLAAITMNARSILVFEQLQNAARIEVNFD